MNKTIYLQHYREVMAKAAALDPEGNEHVQSLFSFFSANLLHYLPVINPADHVAAFRLCCGYQKMSRVDQGYFGPDFPLAIQGWEAGWVDRVRNEPGIISTMHAGSYRLFSFLLAQAGIPFAVLVRQRVQTGQAEEMAQLAARLGLRAGDVPIIVAEEPAAALTMARLLKRGTSLLVYLDGDTGAALSDRSTLVRTPFLGQHIHARRGVPYLAHRLRVPIYPVLNFRQDSETIRVFTCEPLRSVGGELRAFEQHAVGTIYQWFASLLLHYPMQWEHWFFLHMNIDVDNRIEPPLHSLNGEPADAGLLYGLIEDGEELFVLSKRHYGITPFGAYSI